MAEEKKYLTAEEFIEGVVDKGREVELPGLGTIKVRSINQFDMLKAMMYDGFDRIAFLVKNSIIEPELPDSVVATILNGDTSPLFAYALDVIRQVAEINKATPEPGKEGAA